MQGIIFVIVALVIGLGLGWFFGSRSGSHWRGQYEARDAQARELDEKFRKAIAELAAEGERASRADALARSLDTARVDHAEHLDRVRSEHAAALDHLRSTHAAQLDALQRERNGAAFELATLRQKTANFEEQKRLLIEAQELLRKEFENSGAKVLQTAQDAFLQRAGARFEESERTNAERIRTMLEPVGARLKSYEEQVATLEIAPG